MVETEGPKDALTKDALKGVRRLLEKNGMASLSELKLELHITRNWLSGFMSALVALGIVECKGTRTYKLYVVVER